MHRHLMMGLVALVVCGCAVPPLNGDGRTVFQEGRLLVEAGNPEQGLARVLEASKLEPGNQEYRTYYYRQRDAAVQRYIAIAEHARANNQFELAEEAYRRVLPLDPANARVAAALEAVSIERRHRALITEAETQFKQGDVDGALAKARQILTENSNHRDAQSLVRRVEERAAKPATPQLSAALRKPVTLEFRDAPLRSVFEIIAKQSGLNFLFDRDVPADLKATVFVKNTTIEDVIRFVLVTNQLERKVLNENTLLIYPNTPAKNRDYREYVVRSFYLSNADVKQTANMIRAMVRTRDLFVDEKLNLLVMRDTPEAVRLAERLVANQDLGEPEVMLEVEVLEVGSSLLQQLGIQWVDQISYSLLGANPAAGTVGLPGSSRFIITDPLFVINLKKQDGKTNLLANPRIRVKNRDKARVHIGDRVPVITTTTTSTGFVAESVTYLDVGLKLEVEPQVFLENDVAIKVGLEVSSISREIVSRTGTVTYQVGTRNTSTTLRLKDGETQVLAGLISDEERRTANKVPGLGDLPVLGRLFGSTGDTVNRTEIVLLITPRVVRNLVRTELRLEEFPGGTDSSIGAEPLGLPPGGPFPTGPAAGLAPVPGPTPAPIPGSTPAPIPGSAPTPAPGSNAPAPPPGAAPTPTPGPTPAPGQTLLPVPSMR